MSQEFLISLSGHLSFLFFWRPCKIFDVFVSQSKNLAAASLKRHAFRLSFSSHLNYTLSE